MWGEACQNLEVQAQPLTWFVLQVKTKKGWVVFLIVVDTCVSIVVMFMTALYGNSLLCGPMKQYYIISLRFPWLNINIWSMPLQKMCAACGGGPGTLVSFYVCVCGVCVCGGGGGG